MSLVQFIQAIILGTVQGITEFLPVSSTGHLIILEHLFGLDQNIYGLSFDMFTNLGTLLAVILFFRHDLSEIFGSLLRPSTRNKEKTALAKWIIGVTVLVALAGLLFEDVIDSTLRSPWIVAASLAGVGAVLLMAEHFTQNHSSNKPVTAKTIYGIGLTQILAFIPGVSRSGATMSAGLFLGLDRSQAARYSFLLSVPITAAAVAKRLLTFGGDVSAQGIKSDVALFYLVGAVTAGIVGYFTIKYLLQYLSKYSLRPFAYYRFALAFILVLYLSF